jgi:uncharacterized membrane protein
MTIERILSAALILHVTGGVVSLITGLIAILTRKGSKPHRLAGKIYFWGMTAVFIGALVLAILKENNFLLMVGFFSYYMTVRGYRILSLKKLGEQKPAALDWFITSVSGLFILALVAWGIYVLVAFGSGMGAVALAFGGIGAAFLRTDINNYVNGPKQKMHWWFTHLGSMSGSYIAATTAFLVVNIQLPQYNWTLWLLPTVIGSILISRSVRKYKIQFGIK